MDPGPYRPTLRIAGRTYHYDVESWTRLAPVAIVIVQHNGVELTRLAVDAIRKFTPPEQADIWIVDNASDEATRDATQMLGASVIWNHTPVHRWWRGERPHHVGSLANAVALEIAAQQIASPRWLFAMHNDSFPVRHGWLDTFTARPEKMAGYKASQRSGAPHSAGVLFDLAWLRSLGHGALLPDLPRYDVAEGPARFTSHWSAPARTHTADHPIAGLPDWLRAREGVEVSYHEGEIMYVHAGGGTINRQDMRTWIATARGELGL